MIHPKTWKTFVALRVEIYGCREGENVFDLWSSPAVNGSDS